MSNRSGQDHGRFDPPSTADPKTRTYFNRLLSRSSVRKDVHLVVVAHLVDSAVDFLPLLNQYFTVSGVLYKRSSKRSSVERFIRDSMPETILYQLDRQEFRQDPAFFVSRLIRSDLPVGTPIILVDIGGYFAESSSDYPSGPARIQSVIDDLGYVFLGIVEDTQNGHLRYEDSMVQEDGTTRPTAPVYSVAHSPLKKPENHLVGVAITFSIEAILRRSNVVLQSRRVGVIGFGPIGRSVAHSMRNRGVPVRVCEVDPIRLAIAAAQGFHVHHYYDDFTSFAHDLNLIVSATGAGAHQEARTSAEEPVSFETVSRPDRLRARRKLPLGRDTVRYLEPGCFVASVTSQDDEIDLESISAAYESEEVPSNPDILTLSEIVREENSLVPSRQHYFHLMARGNAVNFRDNGVIGPAIQLLQGEIIACVQKLLIREDRQAQSRVLELSEAERRVVADCWLDQYLIEDMQRA